MEHTNFRSAESDLSQRKLIQGEYYSSPIEQVNSQVDMAINHVFSISKHIFGESDKSFIGYTEETLIDFQSKLTTKLPTAYVQFLRYLGASEISVFYGQKFSITAYFQANEAFVNFFENNNLDNDIIENKVIFSDWIGYEFFLFDDDNLDPKVYNLSCSEEEGTSVIYEYPSFSNWLVQLVLAALEIAYDDNFGYSEDARSQLIEEAIRSTKSLMKSFE